MLNTKRFLALDVFRGLTICLMIIVNTPGNGATTFGPFQHAQWHGFTPTDLVFPSFLFAVGNAMSFVMLKWDTLLPTDVVLKIVKRTAIIFLLGYLMYWFPFFKLDAQHHIISFPFAETRVLGVLQRIALCYGLAALLVYFAKSTTTIVIGIGGLLLYWLLLYIGGDYTMQGNIGLIIDKAILGDKHLYHGEGIAFDPEGFLSTLPAISNVLAGFFVGKYLQQKGKTYETVFHLMLVGFGLIVLAYWWNWVFPINKKLWTSSFVAHTVGLDCLIIGAIVYWIEIKGNNKGTYFFEVFGKNPLIIYLLSELLATILYMTPIGKTSSFAWIYTHIFSYAGGNWGSLLFAVSYMLLCWTVGFWMDKRKIYIRV